MQMNLGYPIKHWLTTLVISPAIMIVGDTIANSKLMTDAMGIYFLFVLFGLIFSIPALLVYVIIFESIARTNRSALMVKTILNLTGAFAVLVTFLIIDGSMAKTPSIVYTVGLLIGSLFYKVKTDKPNE
ncbi:MAG: hypothetical protein K0Q66_1438 [Chitinophagaceae bacterium]|jgi:hypothetical protein|nr:hypothetical protein [Chitinophagaceae bacterium]